MFIVTQVSSLSKFAAVVLVRVPGSSKYVFIFIRCADADALVLVLES